MNRIMEKSVSLTNKSVTVFEVIYENLWRTDDSVSSSDKKIVVSTVKNPETPTRIDLLN